MLRIVKHVASLSASTAFISIAQAAILLVVARSADPAEFGVFAYWLSISAVLTVLTTVRGNQLIITASSMAQAYRVSVGLMPIMLSFIPISYLVCFALSPSIDSLLYPLATGLAAYTSAQVEIFRAVLVRLKRYRRAALVPCERFLVSAILTVWLLNISESLDIVYLAYSSGQVLLGLWFSLRLLRKISVAQSINLLGKQRSHFTFGLGALAISSMSTSGLPAIFRALFGAEVAGAFFLVQRAVALPFSVLIRAVSEVVISSDSHSPGRTRVRRKAAGIMSVVFFGAILFAAVFYYFDLGATMMLLFGNNWRGAGLDLSVLVAMITLTSAVQLVVSPWTLDFTANHRSDVLFKWESARLCVVVGVLYWLAEIGAAPEIGIVAWSCLSMVFYVVLELLRRYLIAARCRQVRSNTLDHDFDNRVE